MTVKANVNSSGPTPRPGSGAPLTRKNTNVARNRAGEAWTCSAALANSIVKAQAMYIAGSTATPSLRGTPRASERCAARNATSAIRTGTARSNLARTAPRQPVLSLSPAIPTRCISKAMEATAVTTLARSGHRDADQSPTAADHSLLLPSPPGEPCTPLGQRADLLTDQARSARSARRGRDVVAMACDRRRRQPHRCSPVDRRFPDLGRTPRDLSHPRGRPHAALGLGRDVVV